MKNLLFSNFLFLSIFGISQVQQNVIIEHFTNTRCGICGVRNPGLYTNISEYPEIIHIAFHPSSPYSTCLFNKENPDGNDDRTNYYGIYGSTPKIVIQGNNISASEDYTDSSIFTNYLRQTTAFDIEFLQTELIDSQIYVQVLIERKDTSSLEELNLYIALVEDTINYDAPNGEKTHYDVFKTALTPSNGINIAIEGKDTVTYLNGAALNSEWNLDMLSPIAIIQDNDKAVVQAKKGNRISIASSIQELNNQLVKVYPNPSSSIFNLNSLQENVSIFDTFGKLIKHYSITNTIDLTEFDQGIYLLKTTEGIQRLIKM